MITVDRLNGLDLSAPGNDIVTLKKCYCFFTEQEKCFHRGALIYLSYL